MLTSPQRYDTTTDGRRYSAQTVSPNVGDMRGTSTMRETRVRDVTDYSILIPTSQFDSSFARELWLIGSNFNRQDTDRKSSLRKQVLSYRGERPHVSSVAQAVNDALKFIDLIPATAILPYVALADDGEVNFFWRRDGLFIDIGFVGDGMMHYYVSVDAQGVDSDASIPFSGRSLPRDIVKTMPRLRDEFGTDSHGRVY